MIVVDASAVLDGLLDPATHTDLAACLAGAAEPLAAPDLIDAEVLQAMLNDAVQRAAAATGATYIDFSQVSEGHDACQPLGVRWIEPAVAGTNPVIVHPNALGESQMAAQTMTLLHLG